MATNLTKYIADIDALLAIVDGGRPTRELTASGTLVLADRYKTVLMNCAEANDLTVPPNAEVAYAIGIEIPVMSMGAGQTTIVAGAGVTINSADGATKLRTQYSGGSLKKTATNTWLLVGDLTV